MWKLNYLNNYFVGTYSEQHCIARIIKKVIIDFEIYLL